MAWVKCPVCEGKGLVPAGFYNISSAPVPRTSPEQCRTCAGTGVLHELQRPTVVHRSCGTCQKMRFGSCGSHRSAEYYCGLDQEMHAESHVCENYQAKY